MPTKYIFISGGVISTLGKGVAAASIGLLLKSAGFKVTPVKCENYLNLDAGLINPIEHGDVFLCDDGTEADMDLGTYEKILDQNVGKSNFITMGQIYKTVIDKERNFGYDGEDVEAIPNVTDEIIQRITEAGQKENTDIVIVEFGGTAGEYQNTLYYEASRIMALRQKDSVIHIHVSYLPTPSHINEPKTKPTQMSVRLLNSMGIQPDFIIARSERPIDARRRDRFALFCNVDPEHIIDDPDVKNYLELPIIFNKQNITEKIEKSLELPISHPKLLNWEKYINKLKSFKEKTVKISIVGKYFGTGEYQLKDSYAALLDALNHAAIVKGVNLDIRFINAEAVEKDGLEAIGDTDGIIVPIGWGKRGVEGKIKAIQYAREKKIPYLGLCYGMQLAIVEFARNVLGLINANTTEVDPKTPYPVIHLIEAQKKTLKYRAYGGTMRLGAWDCRVEEKTMAYDLYKENNWLTNSVNIVSERHRHRYEFNNKFRSQFEKAGMIFSGKAVLEDLVEIIELLKSTHPFFLATQFHPEYKSRPLRPHPLFLAFLEACQS